MASFRNKILGKRGVFRPNEIDDRRVFTKLSYGDEDDEIESILLGDSQDFVPGTPEGDQVEEFSEEEPASLPPDVIDEREDQLEEFPEDRNISEEFRAELLYDVGKLPAGMMYRYIQNFERLYSEGRLTSKRLQSQIHGLLNMSRSLNRGVSKLEMKLQSSDLDE